MFFHQPKSALFVIVALIAMLLLSGASPVAADTPTAVPSAATSVNATATVIAPTATRVPATTVITPTVPITQATSTRTSVPVTATAVPPTATRVPPTATRTSVQSPAPAARAPNAPTAIVSLEATADTWLRQSQATRNYGATTTIQASPNTSSRQNSLYLWNLSSIPAGSTVTAASITFYVTDVSAYDFSLYQMRRNWVEGTNNDADGTGASWTYSEAGADAWATAGAMSTTTDRYNTDLWDATASTFGTTGSVTIPLNSSGVAAVQNWITTPANNFGLTVQYMGSGTTADYWIVAARDHASNAGATLNITYNPPGPSITTTGTLTYYGSVPGTPSAQQSYAVSGANLTSAIVITPPTDYELSLTSGSGFSSSPISLTPSGGTVAATTIYVRLNRSTVGTSGGNITNVSTGATTQNVAVGGTALPLTSWVAYDDSSWQSGQTNPANTTTILGISGTGTLLNFASGASTGVPAAFTSSGSPTMYATNGAATNSGTDAYITFNNTANMIGVINYGSTTGWYIDLTFTGLDPARTYTFATSANRDDATYTDRFSKFTISDISAAINASTYGVSVSTTSIAGDTSAFLTGYNRINGYVARWANIQPGSDGDFTVRVQSNGTVNEAYGFSVFMLAEEASTGPTISTVGTLSAFSTTTYSPSAAQTYSVSGTNLTADITINAPTGYQLSTNGTNYYSSLTLTQSGGSVPSTTIYVRLSSPTEGTFNGNITHTSAGATTRNVAVSGTVSNTVCTTANLTAVEDTYLSANDVTFNNGGNVSIHVNGTTGTDRRTALLRWDLSSIPTNATVSSSSISLYVTDASSVAYNLYNMRRTWVEGTSSQAASSTSANWNTYDGVNSWGTEGAANITTDRYDTNLWNATTGSFSTVNSSATVTLNTNGVAVVQGWIAGTTSNYGLIIQTYAGSSNTFYFSSSEATTAANRPILNVTYCAVVNHAPSQPVLVQPLDNATDVSISPTLEVTVSDPDSNAMNVTFYGRAIASAPGADFAIVVLPDTQNMATSYPAVLNSMTQWIADNKTSQNIVFATNVGDIVNTATSTTEYTRADTAYDLLDTGAVFYSVGPGNHDMGSGSLYPTYFGTSRFSGKSYYGGSYNDYNTYYLFSASGMDFILINLQYSPTTAILDWADARLKAYPSRRAIVEQHDILNVDNSWVNQTSYNSLRDNPNLFLMLSGHMHTPTDGAAYFAGTGTDGHTIHIVMQDYQDYTSGGNGYLRIYRFSPTTDTIYMTTYSPYSSGSITTSPDQMNLAYDMTGSAFTVIGTVNNVAAGSTASINWTPLQFLTQYEWYVTASDAAGTTASSVWEFTTRDYPTAVTLSSFSASANGLPGGWLTMLGVAIGILVTAVGGRRLLKR